MAELHQTTQPTREDCEVLRAELHLGFMDGGIGITSSGFLVIIYEKVKQPPLTKFRGWQVRYRIGGGMPRACAA